LGWWTKAVGSSTAACVGSGSNSASVGLVCVGIAWAGGSLGGESVGTAWQASSVRMKNKLVMEKIIFVMPIFVLSELTILPILLNSTNHVKTSARSLVSNE
jgi:hypothetical protein